MRPTCHQLIQAMEKLAPHRLREEWDNCGLLAGSFNRPVKKVLVALEVTDGVVDEAVAIHADMLIVHHPIIRKGLLHITDGDASGRRLLTLIQQNIAVFAAHTNLDTAIGGINDVLFDMLALNNKEPFMPAKDDYAFGLGRIGTLAEAMPIKQFAVFVKQALGAPFVTYSGDDGAVVKRVAVLSGGGGSNADLIKMAAANGCQAYVTGDVTHHMAHLANDLSLGLIDASHYYTEVIITQTLSDCLTQYCVDNGLNTAIHQSQINGQVIKLA